MNKYTKNMIWFNLEKLITLAVVLGMLVLTITCATSCSMNKKVTMDKNGIYHQKNAYEPWNIK